MKVMSIKSGQAKPNSSVEDGLADLKHGFKLGQPENPYIPPYCNQSQTSQSTKNETMKCM